MVHYGQRSGSICMTYTECMCMRAAEDPEPPHEALLLDGKMQAGDAEENMPHIVCLEGGGGF